LTAESKGLEECDKPPGHASIGLDQPWQALCKNLVRAGRGATDEFAHRAHQKYITTRTGQIGDRSLIVPMHASRELVALWTRHARSMTRYTNDEFGDTGMNGGDRDSSGEV